MSFLTTRLFDIQLWIWLFLLFSWSTIGFAFLYWKREQVRRIYYSLRFPERAIRIIIHFPNNLYRVYWRLVPSKRILEINRKKYVYDKDQVTKDSEIYITNDGKDKPLMYVVQNLFTKKDHKGNELIKIGDLKPFVFDAKAVLKQKWTKYPEIHYFFNNPFPLQFDVSKVDIEINSEQLKELQENELFSTLLSLKGQKLMFLLIAVMVGVNMLITIFILAKQMGWIE